MCRGLPIPPHNNKEDRVEERLRNCILFFLMALIIFIGGLSIAEISEKKVENEGNAKRGETLFSSPLYLGTLPISCASCHPGGQGLEMTYGKKEFSIFGAKTQKLESVINFWIVDVMRGEPLKPDSQSMKDVKAYIKSLYGKPPWPLPKAIPLEQFDVPEFYGG